ncbi:MAG: hypothetical protein ACJ749_02560 [Flavisolibacter sp.]
MRKKIIETGFHLKYIPKGRLNDLKELADKFPFVENKDLALSKHVEFISSLIERSLNADKEKVAVNFDYQRRLLGLEYGFKQFIQSLVDAGFIKQDKSNFKVGQCSFEYKPIYDELEMVKIECAAMPKKTNQMLKGQTAATTSQDLIGYKNVIDKITIDNTIYNDVNDIVNKLLEKENNKKNKKQNTNNPFNYSSVPYGEILENAVSTYYSSVPCATTGGSSASPHYSSVPFTSVGVMPKELLPVFKIMTGAIKVHRPVDNSRVYSNITNLSRHFRPYLRLNGEALKGFDIANSQPLLATIAFRRYSENEYGEVKQDVLDYQKACESGKFYEYFMGLNSIDMNSDEARTEFKGRFFAEVFYSMNYEKAPAMLQQFIDKYPTCYEAIYRLKGGKWYAKEYKDFPAIMTEIETDIIWATNVEMIEAGYDVVNIFDSLLSDSKEAIANAKKKVLDRFKVYGITPTLKDIDYSTKPAAEAAPVQAKPKPMTKAEFYSKGSYAMMAPAMFTKDYNEYLIKMTQ